MAVRNDFTAGEVLAAADLNDTFAEKVGNSIVDAKGDLIAATAADTLARLAVGANGAVLTADSTATTGLRWSAGQKILQIVRATDSTNRTTTSTSFVDASGMSVSITPQKSDSAIIVISIFRCGIGSADDGVLARLTDSSNNALSGAESMLFLVDAGQITHSTHTLIGYSTPSSVSQQTYKVRFCATPTAVTATIANATNTGQLYAIEVSA